MDEKQMVSLNALNQAVKEAHPKFAAKFEGKASAVNAPTDPSAAVAVEGGFCAVCEKVRPFLNMAIKAASLFAPASIVALGKAFMAAVYGQIVPAICGPQK